FFSTAFDPTAIAHLEQLHVPLHKVASFEIVDLPLIARMARTGKPLIISTAMATRAEIADAVDCAREAGAAGLALLKCTSAYPALPLCGGERQGRPCVQRSECARDPSRPRHASQIVLGDAGMSRSSGHCRRRAADLGNDRAATLELICGPIPRRRRQRAGIAR